MKCGYDWSFVLCVRNQEPIIELDNENEHFKN